MTESLDLQLDIRPIESQGTVQELTTVTANWEVRTLDDMSAGTDLMKRIGAAIRTLDETRGTWVRPLNDYVRRINERFKGLMGPLKDAREALRARMGTFQAELDRKAEEEAARALKELEEKALAEAKALEDEAARLAAQGKVDEAVEVSAAASEKITEAIETPQPVAIAPQQHRGAYGSTASMRETWHWEVVDINKTPPDLLWVREKEINALVRAGRREIPGLRIFSTKKMVAR